MLVLQCPHLLNLPDLPEGLHSLVCRTAPSFLPSTDPSAVAAKRARQQELVAKAAQAMEQAALEVARKGIAAQVVRGAGCVCGRLCVRQVARAAGCACGCRWGGRRWQRAMCWPGRALKHSF